MQLSEIVDIGMLANEIDAGYVTERYHPEFGELAILNYTDKAQFDRHWTNVTRVTRGLIYNRKTGEVVARGLPKFFNYGDEEHTGQLAPDMPILSAHDKIDGSLGIGYMRPDGRAAIATRGSFSSEQALHATAIMSVEERVAIRLGAREGKTHLWEIIYPENRIVLDYGDRDELVHLGAVHVATGSFGAVMTGLDDFLPADRATLRDVLEREPRKNAEGYVIWLSPTQAVKLKQDDYKALHRIVSNLTVKEVWRQLRDGTFQEFAEALPDEFHEWAKREQEALAMEFDALEVEAGDMLIDMRNAAGWIATRKDQALWIQRNVRPKIRGLVFSLLDGKDLAPAIWRMVEPKEKVAA